MNKVLPYMVCMLLMTSCGSDESTEPGDSFDLAGTWSLLITVTGGQQMPAGTQFSAVMTVTQSGNHVTGNSVAEGGITAQVTGTVSNTHFTFTLNQNPPCVGTFSGSGTIAESVDRITASYSGSDCNGSLEADLVAERGGLIEMVPIPGGTFQMGSTSGWAMPDEQPVHEVTVSAFHISKYEVTQEQYEMVMGTNPSLHSGNDRPVERVSWYDAAQFCNALSESEGRTPCYNENDWSVNFGANGYRLPTEAEWEYACRGGTTTDYHNGYETHSGCSPLDSTLTAIAWYCGNSDYEADGTYNVGQKAANSYGLHDMSGNVWEWCHDWYGNYSASAQNNPTGPASGSNRVIRGGGVATLAQYCRSAFREAHTPDAANYGDQGFRIVTR